MNHKLVLGKVDYNETGMKNCEAIITWKFENGNFSMSAEVWNPRHTDIYCGGQCVDTVAAYFPANAKAQRMVEIWKRWHLNDMRAGCQHQRASHWEDRRINPEELPNHRGNRDEQGFLASWVLPTEHVDGVLTKACPTCGYKYGSAWLKETIPPEIAKEIEGWVDN